MKIVLHNSVSLDGSLLGFDADLAAHYRIAGGFKAGIHLVGSETALVGLKTFFRKLPAERESDLVKPDANPRLPLWVIPDTHGRLKNKLHVLRQAGYCRDVVILTASHTPKGYLHYLTERHYDWHYMGKRPVQYDHAFDVLAREYKARTLLVDAGKTLNGILLNAGLVDEISLLVHPALAGGGRFPLFADLKADGRLRLLKHKGVAGKLWLHYRVDAAAKK